MAPADAHQAAERAALAQSPAVVSAAAVRPTACPPAAMAGSRTLTHLVLQPAQPKQLPAGKAAASVPKPALLAKPGRTSAAATPPIKPASAVAALPSKPASSVAALPIQPTAAAAAPAAPVKPAAKPGAIAAKFSMLGGGTSAASAAGSSLNLLLPKPGVTLGMGTHKPASRLSAQAAGSSMPVSRAPAGLPTAPAAANPAMAGAVSVQPTKQQPQPQRAAPVLRQPMPAALPQAPAGPAAGTPISALPKHMQMAPAAAHRVSSITTAFCNRLAARLGSACPKGCACAK